MSITLQNDFLLVKIDEPEENYNGTRFDWTGKITNVKYKEHTFLTSERLPKKDDNLWGKGLYNEFGIESPVGYEEAIANQYFEKIGVGNLLKDDDTYDFFKQYQMVPADFRNESTNEKSIIYCRSSNENGYAYELKKIFTIDQDTFHIQYFLTNTGKITIQTEEYIHNFMAFDNELLNKDYELLFDFNLQTEKFIETVNPDAAINVGKDRFTVQSTPTNQFFFSNLSGNMPVDAKWTLIHKDKKIGVSETGDFKTNKINLWGDRHVISPELFYLVNVKPGETAGWKRSYRFFS